jgi:hypothetical protein
MKPSILLSMALAGLLEFGFNSAVTKEGRAYAEASVAAPDLSQIRRPDS